MKSLINNIKENFRAYIIVLFIGAAFAYMIIPSSGTSIQKQHNTEKSSGSEVWTCSMHPQIKMPEKGDCPICGMDLIIQKNTDTNTSPYVIKMRPEAIELANIQTSIVGSTNSPGKKIILQGEVKIDESRNYSQTAHYGGRIEKLFIKAEGDKIYKGQKIASIYSPKMLTAQEEFIQAIDMKKQYPEIYTAARKKLINLKISKDEIKEIETTGIGLKYFTIESEYSGYITNKLINKGDYIKIGQTLYDIADMNKLWVEFDVYEKDLSFIKLGDIIEYKIQSIKSKTFKSKLIHIDPVIDTKTRVAKIRVLVNNKSKIIKAKMFAEGIISSKLNIKSSVMSINKSAVMWTGKRSVVYIKVNDGFEMREVILGESLGDKYLIESGIKVGDRVVTNGSFTVDAAAQLNNKYSMMNRPKNMKKTMFMGDKLSRKSKDKYFEFLNIYLNLKDLLVNDESKKASMVSKLGMKKLLEINPFLKNSEIKDLWNKHFDDLYLKMKKLSETQDIEKERILFINISEINIAIIKRIGKNKHNLYIQFCSMADHNNGAWWISENKEINNPYFGEKMLHCGETKTSIK